MIGEHRRLKADAHIRYAIKTPYRYRTSRAEPSPPPPEEKINPIHLAKAWLGNRLVEKGGFYLLDNVPSGLNQIMWATNHVLVANDMEQVTHNPMWRV